jgi:hypothetical protein
LFFIVPMPTKVCLVAALVCGAALYAQNQNPPAPPEVLKPHAYVRRVSAGATLSVLVLNLVPTGALNISTTSPPLDALYTTAGTMHRIGWGFQAQAAIRERFAVNAGFLVRRAGYKMTSETYEGTDNPNTIVDDRTHTIRNEDTQAKFFDFPVVLRYYGKDRHQPGPRWFVEGGGVLRRVFGIKTSIDTTVGSADTVCCDTTPATPARRTIRGFVGGLGVQVIDPVGIRVVPEVRYTRWAGHTFDSLSTQTQGNQLEAMISLTF